MTEYFEVGKILSPHGLTGEVKVNATTDFPEERLANGSRLFIKLHVVINNSTWLNLKE